jgi:hypothetical protein
MNMWRHVLRGWWQIKSPEDYTAPRLAMSPATSASFPASRTATHSFTPDVRVVFVISCFLDHVCARAGSDLAFSLIMCHNLSYLGPYRCSVQAHALTDQGSVIIYAEYMRIIEMYGFFFVCLF